MKIFLTGGNGMVGRNILENSSAEKHQIISPNSTQLNLLKQNDVQQFIRKAMPDVIVHAAGRVGGIQANMADPIGFLNDNLIIGMNVISSADVVGVPRLINIASSCMYPRDAPNPLRESEILSGKLEPTNEGYALAKIYCTKLCEYTTKENHNLNYKTIIPCNLYGRYDKYGPANSHLIPAVIRKIHDANARRQKVVTIWGDGNARREFMCAYDIADFIFYAIENFEKMPQTLNVGIGRDYSINEYYQAIGSVLNYSGTFDNDLSKPVGMRQKLVDITKLTKFGWNYKVNLIQGVEVAYNYFKTREYGI